MVTKYMIDIRPEIHWPIQSFVIYLTLMGLTAYFGLGHLMEAGEVPESLVFSQWFVACLIAGAMLLILAGLPGGVIVFLLSLVVYAGILVWTSVTLEADRLDAAMCSIIAILSTSSVNRLSRADGSQGLTRMAHRVAVGIALATPLLFFAAGIKGVLWGVGWSFYFLLAARWSLVIGEGLALPWRTAGR